MNSLVARLTVAAAVLAALPCSAAAPAAARVTPLPGPVLDAVVAAVMELQAATATGSPAKRLDAMAGFQPTPATAAKLVKVFGNDHPFSVIRTAAPKGQLGYRLSLQPLDYTGEDGAHTEWTELSAQATLANGGHTLAIKGQWAALTADDKYVRMSMRDMRFDSRQTLGAGGLWFGKAQGDIASARAEAKGTGIGLALDDIRLATSVVQRAKLMEVHYGLTVKSVALLGEQADDFRLAARLTNLDIGEMAALKAASERPMAGLAPVQQLEALAPVFKRFARAMLAHGTAVEIDDLSLRYKGRAATLKGHIGFAGAAEDIDSLPALLKKIVARLELRVPVALLQDAARAVARKQVPAGQPVNEQAIEQVAQGMTDVVLGRVLGGGYARLEDGVLVALIEIKDGTLRVNGKEILLPGVPPQAPAPPGAPPRMPGPSAAYLAARRLDGSCTLPPYPDEVLRQNLPLAMSARFIVGADGRVRELVLAKASAWPEFDRAALAAIGTCRYAPALRNGQPSDSPMRWNVVRDPAQEAPAGTENGPG